MIFKIADGRECFYQWDIDRQIIVSDPTIKEVHFCNRTDVCSLVVEVVDGVANVPNKLLQSGFDVRVFGYDGKATMHEATFTVKARTQPTDYVYTEVEIKRYSDLEKRIDEMEALTGEAIEDAVNSYLEENPITMDGYATEEYVNEAVSNVKPDLTGYATEAYVDEAVKNVKVDVNLDDYAKKTDIPDVSDFISEIPDEYITESELNAKGYATKAELNDKANANHTHSEYAKTTHTHSTADVDGLQKALNEKATQADIDKAIELHDHRYDYAPIEHSHGDEYAAKTHTHSYNNLLDKPTIPSVEGLASEAYVDAAVKNAKPDLTGYATEKYVDDAIAGIEIPEAEPTDLSNYYTKEETYSKTEVDEAIAAIEIPVGPGGDVDLSDYYTKEETDELISDINQCNTYFFNAEAVEWLNRGHTPAPASLAEFAQRLIAGEAVNLWVAQLVVGKVRWLPAEFIISTVNDVLCVEFVQGISVTDIGKEDTIQAYRVYPNDTVGWAVAKLSPHANFIADKTYVDTAIQDALNAIGVAEGGAY